MAAPGLRLSIFQSFALQVLNFLVFLNFVGFYAAEDQRYRNCTHNFSCGESIREIGYPFWGGDRPSECGVKSLELRCSHNSTTINITGEPYRLLSVDVNNSVMRIVRTDLLGGQDGLCQDWFPNTPSSIDHDSGDDHLRFEYPNDNMYLLYSCSRRPAVNTSSIFHFSCPSNDSTGVNLNYAVDEALLNLEFPKGLSCQHNLTVPVDETKLKELTTNRTMSITNSGLNELLSGGFEVQYKMNVTPCATCKHLGGLCWSGTNSNNPTCLCPTGRPRLNCKGNERNWRLKLGIASSGVVCTVLGILGIFYIIRISGLHRRYLQSSNEIEHFLLNNGSLAPKRYSYDEIKRITKSFSDKLGQGGYGSVYKGWLSDGQIIAVKVLTEADAGGEEFINEVASISRTSHINIVNLLGFCYDGRRRALVYEFMPNKSLDKFIYLSGKQSNLECQLGLKKLYDIAVGVAKGLEYLHRGCNSRMVHFDIKPHNILLDKDFCPKISDFGLAKLYKKDQSIISLLGTRGTIGYIAPEVFSRNFGTISHKSDVYSYGMMLLQMSGASRINEIEATTSSDNYFFDKIFKYAVVNNSKFNALISEADEEETARKMLLVGLWCTQTAPSDRPSMNKVVEMLEGSLQAIQIPPKPFLSTSMMLAPQISSSFSTDVHTQGL